MRLFLCEKPSQGKDIGRILGATQRGEGCHRRLAGETAQLPTVTPFHAYVQWQAGQDRPAAQAYWRRALVALHEPLLLARAVRPLDGTAPGLGRLERSFTSELTGKLARYAQTQRVTLNTVVQGATLLALASVVRRGQPVLGVTVAGRHAPLPGILDMKGLFINTVPLAMALPAMSETGDWLRALQQENLQLRDNAFLPLVDIHACSSVPRGLPLFDVIFVFENHPVGESLQRDLEHLGVSRVQSQHRNGYPLTVIVWPEESMRFLILHEGSALDAAQAGAIFERMQRVLETWVEGGGRLLGEIAFTQHVPDARDSMVVPAAISAVALPAKDAPALPHVDIVNSDAELGGLHRAVEHWATRTPHAVAVVCEGQALSYGELNARANRLARRLVAVGVGPDRLVGLALGRSHDLIVAILATLKAGGAYLPLDPDYPAQRLAYLLQDAQPTVILAHAHYAGTLIGLAPELPLLKLDVLTGDDTHAESSGWARASDLTNTEIDTAANLDLSVHPSQLAYCIYTSGSTGQPKGALLTHANVQRLFNAARVRFDFGAQDVWTLFHSYAFDFSVWEIFGALGHGGRLVIVPFQNSRSPEDLLALLEREQVTVLNQTPSAFRQLLDVPGVYVRLRAVPLRYVIFGGETLDPRSLVRWFEEMGENAPALVNMYGITETTVHVTHHPV
ncbi:hypothetical protein C1I89_14735 [Achromobacter pulmonis]|uniref:Non-ribosomal peptide synthetase n=1 Tax=Achromobacter pulmonis TaxID=1389932 RepID=A0A2N8KJS3_9BURK|nr:hypothetical protein C1I89_14735 [Achromobacter pulmonis]